jgi:hypothetical protein
MKAPTRIASAKCLMCLAFLLQTATTAFAHKQSDSFLTLRVTGTNILGEWHLALRDLEDAIGIDANDDGVITWAELKSRQDEVSAYALSRLRLGSGEATARLRVTGFLVDNHSDGGYVVIRFCAEGLDHTREMELGYHALFDIDASHRGLVRVEDSGHSQLLVFSPNQSCQRIFPQQTHAFSGLAFLKEGIWHIWTGYDHLCFLLALLLPAVLQRREGVWQPLSTISPALSLILKVVTAFTVAHSITLSLAALGVVHLRAALVESAIAASVIIAAFNNLKPLFSDRAWIVAFGFGLIHGFGFANALNDLGLHHGRNAETLLFFNGGVELGQLAIVALLLPFALALRHLLFYRNILLKAASAAIMGLATVWLAERMTDTKWLPF